MALDFALETQDLPPTYHFYTISVRGGLFVYTKEQCLVVGGCVFGPFLPKMEDPLTQLKKKIHDHNNIN